MEGRLQVTFRDVPRSAAIEDAVREKAAKLDEVFDRISAFRVVVEAPHRHHHKGRLYHVRVDVTVPGAELVVSRTQDDKQAHEDAYVAVRDAFAAMRRKLEAHFAKRRGDVKQHDSGGQSMGMVAELEPHRDHGRIETEDGRSVYFHRNSVLNGNFDQLEVGSPVRFVEEAGDEGPQASTVYL
ncbi:MAG: HPF/RaiA family ribosome-associated protein [Leptospirillia bacterium]